MTGLAFFRWEVMFYENAEHPSLRLRGFCFEEWFRLRILRFLFQAFGALWAEGIRVERLGLGDRSLRFFGFTSSNVQPGFLISLTCTEAEAVLVNTTLPILTFVLFWGFQRVHTCLYIPRPCSPLCGLGFRV